MRNAHGNSNAYSNSHSKSNGYIYSDIYCNSYVYSDRHTNSNSDSHNYCPSESVANGIGATYTDCATLHNSQASPYSPTALATLIDEKETYCFDRKSGL
jgi:hypothetical protein